MSVWRSLSKNPEFLRRQEEADEIQRQKLAQAERDIAEREAREEAEKRKRISSNTDQGKNPFLGRYGKQR